jgi:hypothetical protein
LLTGSGGITPSARQRRAQAALTTVWGHHPFPDLPRRIVAHVHGVTALEVRHPVRLVVLMESKDSALHARRGPESIRPMISRRACVSCSATTPRLAVAALV